MPESMRTHYRIERANGGLLCDLWFLTKGCIHDAEGGCTMCNYGKASQSLYQEKVLKELQYIVKKLYWEFEDFLLTPSGSMLDEREVPDEMRERLKELLKDVKTKRFIIETRADTVNENGLHFLQEILPGSEKYVEIGYESGSNWILRNCINKGTSAEDFEHAAALIHKSGIKVTANIAVGIPFLSERASILEAISSVKRAFAQGADSIVIFPYHVKHGTLLEVMYQKGWYNCISLWSLVAVLKGIPQDMLDKVQISWYKDYFGEARSQIFASPSTCGKCGQDVIELLDCYRQDPSPEKLGTLRSYDCQCKQEWKKHLETQEPGVDFGKVEVQYRQLAKEFAVTEEVLEEELLIMKKTLRGKDDADES